MRDSYDHAIEFILKWEGYRSDDSSDPGGRTIFGISARAHPDEVERMWNLPKGEALEIAKEIYRENYWNAMNCNDLSSPLDLVVFDTAVNMGVGRAKEFLKITDNWGEFLLYRIKHYVDLRKKYPQFIFGWLNRVMDLFQNAY